MPPNWQPSGWLQLGEHPTATWWSCGGLCVHCSMMTSHSTCWLVVWATRNQHTLAFQPVWYCGGPGLEALELSFWNPFWKAAGTPAQIALVWAGALFDGAMMAGMAGFLLVMVVAPLAGIAPMVWLCPVILWTALRGSFGFFLFWIVWLFWFFHHYIFCFCFWLWVGRSMWLLWWNHIPSWNLMECLLTI